MPSIVARRVQPQTGQCGARASSQCMNAALPTAQSALPWSCPAPVCPVHRQHSLLYCSEQCFVLHHAAEVNSNSNSPNLSPRTVTSMQAQSLSRSLAVAVPATTAPARPMQRATRVGKYQLGRTLGQGTFGKVKHAVNLETREPVALKMMDKGRIRASNMGEQIKKEIAIMKTLNHTNVIRLIEVLASEKTIYLVMELVNGGELYDMVIARHRFTEDEARHYFRQLISGLSYCHQRGVCHRDLKPENLLLDEQGTLKISDFGLSALEQQSVSQQFAVSNTDISGSGSVGPDSGAGGGELSLTPAYLLHTTCGTPNYVAPEVLMDRGYDGKAADVWSAGVILYVLLAGHLPFDEVSMTDLFRKIVNAEFSFPDFFSPVAIDLLAKILNPNPQVRATIAHIQQHPWFRAGMDADGVADGDDASVVSKPASLAATPMTDTSQNVTPSLTPTLISPAASPPLSPGNTKSAGIPPAITSAVARTYHRTDSEMFLSMDDDEQADEFKARAEHEVDGAATDAESLTGPRKLNAFDLINMAGGAAMNRMFQKRQNPALKNSKLTTFTSTDSAATILNRASAALSTMEDADYRTHSQFAQIRASFDTPRGKVLMVLQIYEMTPSLHLVECSKMKGDLLLYYELYKEMRRRMDDPHSASSSPLQIGDSLTSSVSVSPTTLSPLTVQSMKVRPPNIGTNIPAIQEERKDIDPNNIQSTMLDLPSSAISTGSNSSNGSLRGAKLSILVTPSTPGPPQDESEGTSHSSQLYNRTPNTSERAPVTPDADYRASSDLMRTL